MAYQDRREDLGSIPHQNQSPISDPRGVHTTDDYGQPLGPPPVYKEKFRVTEQYGSGNPKWWNVKAWGWKRWAILGAIVVILLVVIIVAAVVSTKKNKYPNYSKLNYKLVDTYSGESFFDNFNYFTGADPTAGLVHYVPEETAQSSQYNLTYASANSAVLRVDTTVNNSTVPNAETGRFSVRITSKKQYAKGLFIFDVFHSPVGCATWPALWTTDPSNWPTNGEIDIMEAVNVVNDVGNHMALHTNDGCTMKVKRKQSGDTASANCVSNEQYGNDGCAVKADEFTFGPTFNAKRGGVVAMELRSEGIRMWDWWRGAIPADITAGTPDPSTWKTASSDFPNTNCNIDTHFKNQSIIANIDLCGDWAGDASVYAETCPGLCTAQVAYNNTAFADAYWEFGAFQIYQAS